MKLKDQKTFEEAVKANITDDGYGSSAILFACLWAGAMEREIATLGVDKLPEFASKCSSEADEALGYYGVTGFQYGLAVSLLAQCWEYGEQLRVWHNLKTQFHDEGEKANESGEVLNPALVNIETKEG
jgi:hypothetical protein